MNTQFDVPSSIIVGGGSRKGLPEQVRRLEASRVLLVSDAFLVESGVVEEMASGMREEGIDVSVFSDVQPDPTDRNVLDGVEVLRSSSAQAIVAVGGGSPIDTAKVIAVAATNEGPLSAFQGYHRIAKRGLPLIVVPTTAGTGSEATKVAVITDTQRDVKMMMLDRHLLPTVAIVDYELSMTMPASLTANVGVDTLTHAIEAFVSKKSNAMTDPIALSCIDLVARYLERAWKDPDDRKAREGMALAACQGGMAFSNSSVCLVHGMSRPIGAVFHVPHGLSNAILLPEVTRFSVAGAEERYARVSRTMGFASDEETDSAACAALVEGLVALNARLQVPRLSQCRGVDKDRFEANVEKMAQDALDSGSPQNNPLVPTAAEIVDLYRGVY